MYFWHWAPFSFSFPLKKEKGILGPPLHLPAVSRGRRPSLWGRSRSLCSPYGLPWRAGSPHPAWIIGRKNGEQVKPMGMQIFHACSTAKWRGEIKSCSNRVQIVFKSWGDKTSLQCPQEQVWKVQIILKRWKWQTQINQSNQRNKLAQIITRKLWIHQDLRIRDGEFIFMNLGRGIYQLSPFKFSN